MEVFIYTRLLGPNVTSGCVVYINSEVRYWNAIKRHIYPPIAIGVGSAVQRYSLNVSEEWFWGICA